MYKYPISIRQPLMNRLLYRIIRWQRALPRRWEIRILWLKFSRTQNPKWIFRGSTFAALPTEHRHQLGIANVNSATLWGSNLQHITYLGNIFNISIFHKCIFPPNHSSKEWLHTTNSKHQGMSSWVPNCKMCTSISRLHYVNFTLKAQFQLRSKLISLTFPFTLDSIWGCTHCGCGWFFKTF